METAETETRNVSSIIIGQGLAGSTLAWIQHWLGETVFLIDEERSETASRIAAGLITPVTGKRLVWSEDFAEYWEEAVLFYRRVEKETSAELLEVAEMIRLFEDEDSREVFRNRSTTELSGKLTDWEGKLQVKGKIKTGVKVGPAGRLKVRKFLEVTQDFFRHQGCYRKGKVDADQEIFITDSGEVELPGYGLKGNRIIFCQGAEPSSFFPGVPDNPSRGEIQTLKIPGYQVTEVVHRSIWIAAEGNGCQVAGATYDWENLNSGPTETGRREIEEKLDRMVEGPFEVTNHQSAIRPTMKDYEPVIGRSLRSENAYIFNGLGSKGSLRAPLLARQLSQQMTGIAEPNIKRNYARLNTKTTCRQASLTQQAQDFVRSVVQQGETVIDATVGKGFDTVFLSEIVGSTGKVLGFDIQEAALKATSQRLAAHRRNNVSLIHGSHENIAAEAESRSVSAVMFNLGYLPGGEHSVITRPESTLRAIEAALKVLKTGGILTVVAYRGHAGGAEENSQVKALLMASKDEGLLTIVPGEVPKPTSPILYVLRKCQ